MLWLVVQLTIMHTVVICSKGKKNNKWRNNMCNSTSGQQVKLVAVWSVCHVAQRRIFTVIKTEAQLSMLVQNTQQNLELDMYTSLGRNGAFIDFHVHECKALTYQKWIFLFVIITRNARDTKNNPCPVSWWFESCHDDLKILLAFINKRKWLYFSTHRHAQQIFISVCTCIST